jgi:hypothetical protein
MKPSVVARQQLLFVRVALTILCFSGYASTSQGVFFADQVLSYTQGSLGASTLTDPQSALGQPDNFTGEHFGFPNVLSPFSPAFESDEIVQVGAGGQITLRLSHFVSIGAGLEIGVITNVGLVDNTGTGTTGAVAGAFGVDTAIVEVSEDGITWFSLGEIQFNLPATFYNDPAGVGPYSSTAPATAATSDFGKPFAGTLSSFDNKSSYADALAVFDGSGGGNWLELDSSGLTRAGYIRFSLTLGSADPFELDSVVINSALAGEPVPETSLTFLLGVCVLGLFARARKRTIVVVALVAGFAIPCFADFINVGTGANTSFLVIDFKDGAKYQFAVAYDGAADGEDLLTITRDAGLGFDVTLQSFGFGNFVDGIAYDGHTNSGFGGNEDFWHYWTSNAADPPSWALSQVGISDRVVTDGSWDGWVYGSTAEPALVPEPSAAMLILVALAGLLARPR